MSSIARFGLGSQLCSYLECFYSQCLPYWLSHTMLISVQQFFLEVNPLCSNMAHFFKLYLLTPFFFIILIPCNAKSWYLFVFCFFSQNLSFPRTRPLSVFCPQLHACSLLWKLLLGWPKSISMYIPQNKFPLLWIFYNIYNIYKCLLL